jgi:hypothetical protein
MTTPNILLLVDMAVPSGERAGKPARDSAWGTLLRGCDFTQASISDSRIVGGSTAHREAVRINEFDIVILNWDTANGDIKTGSDDTLLYFKVRGEDRRNQLLEHGGKLVCEFQGGSGGLLHQGAYDAIFGDGNFQVMKDPSALGGKNFRHGPTVSVWPEFKDHPLVKNLPPEMSTRYVDGGERLFNFVDGAVDAMFGYKFRHTLFWLGWFRWWKEGWVPLLKAKLPADHPYRSRRPEPAVLLAKCEGNGLLLASCLWMSFSKAQMLVDSILNTDLPSIREYHDSLRRRRLWQSLGTGLLLLLLLRILFLSARAALAAVGKLFVLTLPSWVQQAASHLHPYLVNFGNPVEDFGKIWLIILAGLFFRHWIWKRSYGIGVFTAFVPSLRSLGSFFGLEDR